MQRNNLILAAAIVFGLILFGCGGSGGSGDSSTGGSGTSTSTGGGGGTAAFTVTTVPSAGYVTVAANVTFNVKLNFTDPAAKVQFTSMHVYDEGGENVLQPPGAYGQMETASGTSIDGQEQSSLTAIYAGNSSELVFGGYDDVSVTVFSSKLSGGQSTQIIGVPTGTNWVTLPTAVEATCAGLTENETTVKPGGTIQVTAAITPGLSCTSAVFNVGGFTPSAVTINGKPASLPATYTFAVTAAPFQLVIDLTIPSNSGNIFPVSSTQGGDTGSWLFLTGSGQNGPWGCANPFFIHS